jgi:hypothetical protein
VSAGLVLTRALLAPSEQSRLPQSQVQANTRQSLQALQTFADCIVARKNLETDVRSFLRMPADSEGQGKAGRTIAKSDCMTNIVPANATKAEMKMPSPVLRSAIIEALYRRQFADAPTNFSALPPINVDSEFDGPASPRDQYLRKIGDCIARRAGPQAQELLLASSGSPAEAAALRKVMPDVGPCVPEGNELSFSKPILRGVIAEAMLKLSAAAAAQPKSVN